MPLHPDARKHLDMLKALNAPPMHTLPPAVARANIEKAPRPKGPDVHKVEDTTIPGPAGKIPVRIYTPAGKGPFPVLVWFHGGGWVIGSPSMVDHAIRHVVNKAGCICVSVDYRLAPEHKFPAAADDCYAATKWVAENGKKINADPSHIAVGGDSAGGNLSAVVALMARDRGGPKLVHQVMLYPVIENNFNTKSYQDNATGYLLSRDMMVWFWDLYLNKPKEASHAYVAPIRAADLRGVAPALIVTAEFDPLRDEGEAYGKRLKEFGVPTVVKRYDGMIHGFFGMYETISASNDLINQVSDALKQAFAK